MTRAALAILILLPLAGCYEDRAIPNPNAAESPREVRLVATAPDGTKLWCTPALLGGCAVYFASSGAQWSESCGKGCTRTVHVPTADSDQ